MAHLGTVLQWRWASLQSLCKFELMRYEHVDLTMYSLHRWGMYLLSYRWQINAIRNAPVLNAVGWLAGFSSDSDERASTTKRNFHRQNTISFCCRICNPQPIVTRIANLHNICTWQLKTQHNIVSWAWTPSQNDTETSREELLLFFDWWMIFRTLVATSGAPRLSFGLSLLVLQDGKESILHYIWYLAMIGNLHQSKWFSWGISQQILPGKHPTIAIYQQPVAHKAQISHQHHPSEKVIWCQQTVAILSSYLSVHTGALHRYC